MSNMNHHTAYDDQWRIKWGNYLTSGGRVWPMYEFTVSPRFHDKDRQKISFVTLLEVKKDRYVPVQDIYEIACLEIDGLYGMYNRFADKIEMIREHFIVKDYNTIKAEI